MNKLAVIVLLLGLSACSKSKKTEEGREPVQGATSGAVVGSAAPSAPSAAPAPVTPPNGPPAGSAAAGSAQTNVGCAAASSLVCAADQVDGCMSGLTTVHLCVAKDAKPGAVCAQPGTPCPAGQVDACLHDPPQSIHHVCVVAAKPAPKSDL